MTEMEETIKSLKEMFPKGLCEDDEYKMARVAIKALEKQIPKKPISISSVENSMYVKCPTCKLRTVLYDGCSMDYCKNCGQAIDWSDTE